MTRIPAALKPAIIATIRQLAEQGIPDAAIGQRLTGQGIPITSNTVGELRRGNGIPSGREAATGGDVECPHCQMLVSVSRGRIEDHNGFLGAKTESGVQAPTPCPAGGTTYAQWSVCEVAV